VELSGGDPQFGIVTEIQREVIEIHGEVTEMHGVGTESHGEEKKEGRKSAVNLGEKLCVTLCRIKMNATGLALDGRDCFVACLWIRAANGHERSST